VGLGRAPQSERRNGQAGALSGLGQGPAEREEKWPGWSGVCAPARPRRAILVRGSDADPLGLRAARGPSPPTPASGACAPRPCRGALGTRAEGKCPSRDWGHEPKASVPLATGDTSRRQVSLSRLGTRAEGKCPSRDWGHEPKASVPLATGDTSRRQVSLSRLGTRAEGKCPSRDWEGTRAEGKCPLVCSVRRTAHRALRFRVGRIAPNAKPRGPRGAGERAKNCRRDWVRTNDPYRVKVVLYR
jgi:hypothetical protein